MSLTHYESDPLVPYAGNDPYYGLSHCEQMIE